jgi:hypothetical protein
MAKVPDLRGLKQEDAKAKLEAADLKIGVVTAAHSDSVTAGGVLSSDPAAGTELDSGAEVKLEVSDGPEKAAEPEAPDGPAKAAVPGVSVKVPDVSGKTRQRAEALFNEAGLVVGSIKKHHSSELPKGGIIGTDPEADTLVGAGSSVDLEISKGPERSWTRYIPQIAFSIPGAIILLVIVIVVLDRHQVFLKNLAQTEVARGLITFLIAIATVGIAIILTVSTLILPSGDDGDQRFDRGKQVLTSLIGVLGTIVGFYFASATNSAQQAKTAAIVTAELPAGAISTPYPATMIETVGLTPPMNWSVAPKLPADLSLDQTTGTISGTPTAASPKTSPFKFTVTDSAIPAHVLTKDLPLEIK